MKRVDTKRLIELKVLVVEALSVVCSTIKGLESKNLILEKLEERIGFEPTALRFCKPFLWTTQAPLPKIFIGEESNISNKVSMISSKSYFLLISPSILNLPEPVRKKNTPTAR